MNENKTWHFPSGATLTFTNDYGNECEEYQSLVPYEEVVDLMDATEYVDLTEKTDLSPEQYNEAAKRAGYAIELLHASLGMTTESGEFADAIKKWILYGKELDYVNLQEEVGDLLWYIALVSRQLDIPLESIFNRNIAKLKARYGDKFTEQAALNRDLAAERKALEDHIDNSNHYDIG